MAEQRISVENKGHIVSTLLAAWLLALAFDFLLHGGLLARIYAQSDPFLLSPTEAFRRIPAGYLAFLLLTAGLFWLLSRLDVRGWFAGLRLGFFAGLLVWGSLTLGLYSISTASIDMLMGWWIGQAFELALGRSPSSTVVAGAQALPIRPSPPPSASPIGGWWRSPFRIAYLDPTSHRSMRWKMSAPRSAGAKM